jgi:hypothetical protein
VLLRKEEGGRRRRERKEGGEGGRRKKKKEEGGGRNKVEKANALCPGANFFFPEILTVLKGQKKINRNQVY